MRSILSLREKYRIVQVEAAVHPIETHKIIGPHHFGKVNKCPSINGLFCAGLRSPRVSGCGVHKVRLAANPCAALPSENNLIYE
jgi:hypothetical protein